MTIPKIIHHIAPKDISRWHPIWKRCYPSWKEHFGDFEHKLWEDGEEINNFVKEHYPQYYDMFMDFPAHIMRVDFVRFCILHHYGGIYSDMDMFCYKNFYDELDDCDYILRAPYGESYINGNNLIENALMIGVPNSEFFKYCMETSEKYFYSKIIKHKEKLKFPLNRFEQILVGKTAGPILVSDCYNNFKNSVKILDGILYNNHGMSFHPEYKTKHLLTGIWGNDAIVQIENSLNIQEDLSEKMQNNYIDEIKKYVWIENLTFDNFDFYHDYTNGGMKTHFIPELDTGDIDNKLIGKTFNYN
jgi:hypothetical protein